MAAPDEQLRGVPRTAQELWLDAVIRHQIGLMRVSGGVRNKVWALLDATEQDLKDAIRQQLRRHTGTFRPADLRRMERLLADIEAIRGTAWKDIGALWQAEIGSVALSEPKFMAALFETVTPTQISLSLPDAGRLRAIVTTQPFQGKTLREWTSNIRATDIRRIQDQIRIGLTQNETLPQISRRVVGTVRLRGRDGVTAITRRQAQAVTRTAVNAIANQARQQLWVDNADIVDREIYLATLDSRTTPICRSFDGDIYPVGEGPIPPVHVNCRSLRNAILDAEPIGSRPMKPVTERMLLREFAEERGIPQPLTSRAKLPRGTKGIFDEFARRRTRELVGRVPAKVSYQEFLSRQSAEFQNDLLGRTRGRLFRRGGLTVKQFVDRSGNELTLAQLAERHASAFRAAGLDPAAFLGS